MKQVYKKPVLIMESFTMAQSIAHNCSDELDTSKATLRYQSTCGWDLGFDGGHGDGSDVLFINSNICSFLSEEFDGICYNNPSGGLNIFNS